MQEESISALKSSYQQEFSTLKIELTTLANAVKEFQFSLSAASSTAPNAVPLVQKPMLQLCQANYWELIPKVSLFPTILLVLRW